MQVPAKQDGGQREADTMPQGRKRTATRFAQNPWQTLKVEAATKAKGHLDKADVATAAR